jgi:hypothetical protein
MAANIARLLGALQAQKAEMADSGPFRRIDYHEPRQGH